MFTMRYHKTGGHRPPLQGTSTEQYNVHAIERHYTSQEPLWRDEFSVETATDRYVTRRQFSKFLVLTSLGMFAGNLWILFKSWFQHPTAYTERIVAGMNEIGVGEVKLFSYPEPTD